MESNSENNTEMTEGTQNIQFKHFTIFDGLDDALIDVIDNILTLQHYKKNDIIDLSNKSASNIFFLKSGHVKISRVSADGKEMIVDIIGSGELLGELAFMDEFYDVTEVAQALNDVCICSMQRSDFERLFDPNPHFNTQIAKRIGLRLRKIEERMKDMLFKDVRRRIASFLIRHSEEFGRIKHKSVFIRPYLSHHDIALLTGSTRQTVTSTLNEFRSLGILDFSRQGFTIKDYERLKEIAQ